MTHTVKLETVELAAVAGNILAGVLGGLPPDIARATKILLTCGEREEIIGRAEDLVRRLMDGASQDGTCLKAAILVRAYVAFLAAYEEEPDHQNT